MRLPPKKDDGWWGIKMGMNRHHDETFPHRTYIEMKKLSFNWFVERGMSLSIPLSFLVLQR